jgi:hypothetical protein
MKGLELNRDQTPFIRGVVALDDDDVAPIPIWKAG